MNGYRVLWRPDGQNKLADLWLKVADRRALSQAADEIDAELTHAPQTKGKAIGMGYRRLVVMPLAILFTVHSTQNVVVLHEVRYFPFRLNGAVRK